MQALVPTTWVQPVLPSHTSFRLWQQPRWLVLFSVNLFSWLSSGFFFSSKHFYKSWQVLYNADEGHSFGRCCVDTDVKTWGWTMTSSSVVVTEQYAPSCRNNIWFGFWSREQFDTSTHKFGSFVFFNSSKLFAPSNRKVYKWFARDWFPSCKRLTYNLPNTILPPINSCQRSCGMSVIHSNYRGDELQ